MAEAAASAQRVAEVTLVVGAVAEAVETVAEDVEAVVDGVAVPSAAVVGAEHNLLLQHSHNLPPVLQPHHPKYLLSQ